MSRHLGSLAQRRLIEACNLLWGERLRLTTGGTAEADTRTDEHVPYTRGLPVSSIWAANARNSDGEAEIRS